MRILAMAVIALALSACVQREPRERAANGCARSAAHEVTWSNEAQPDTVTARADGPTCAQAVVLLTVRDHKGDPLWVFASTYYDMTSGGVPPEGAPAVSREQMDAFLAGWANVTVARTSALPEWKEGASSLGDNIAELSYSTPFNREAYETLRQRNLPEVCYAAAVEATQCVIVDPASHAPAMIVAYGP